MTGAGLYLRSVRVADTVAVDYVFYMRLFSELRRRNVLRMAVLYAVAAWLLLQVAEVVTGLAALPDWVGQLLLAVLAVGFPVALIFALGGFLVRNPTMVGGERFLDEAGADPAQGVTRITRHPFQWGVLLWAIAHVLANGDSHSVVFFSTFGVLSGLGTVLMDRKKAAALGERWQRYAAVTSNVPFLAILKGRNRLVLRELVLPVLLGLGAYGALYWGHQWVSGVRLL